MVKNYAKKNGSNLKVFSYPFKVARVGKENTNTNELSIYSLTHYYNWCLSKCSYSYVFKWDADMILQKGQQSLVSRLRRLNPFWPQFVSVEIQTIYQKNDKFFLSLYEVNSEYMIFPNRADVYFKTIRGFEMLQGKIYRTSHIEIDEVHILEWKDTSSNEFDHWTDTNFTTDRKKLEWLNFNKIKNSDIDSNFELFDFYTSLKN